MVEGFYKPFQDPPIGYRLKTKKVFYSYPYDGKSFLYLFNISFLLKHRNLILNEKKYKLLLKSENIING